MRGNPNDERGNTLRDTNPGFIPFGFAGGIVDRDTGLIRYGVRDYDPSVGRWLSKEPLGFNVTTNFYVYADGDPIDKIDIDGTCAVLPEAFIEGASFNATGQLLNDSTHSIDVCEAIAAGIEQALTEGLGGNACFAPETLVETADGERPIADIQVGDRVWSEDEATGERELRTVLQKFVTPDQSLLDLDVVAGSNDEVLRATPSHRFWVDGKGWTSAEDLRVGDTFDLYSGKQAVFAGSERETEKTTVYNLEVDGTHTYFVGDSGVWVHNGCLPNETVVCRGGTCTAGRFASGSGVSADASGRLSGVSVNVGDSLESASEGIVHGQVGTTTVGAVRAVGGDVVSSPTFSQANHGTLSGITAEQAESLFTPTLRNPNK